MCGIFGDITRRGQRPSIPRDEAERLRDSMFSRGPDGAGLWQHENVLLGHRRLAVRTASASGVQPLVTADGRWAVVFNGELYEDQELRAQLATEGFAPQGEGDGATVLAAVAAWGSNACARLRGMFAIAAVDMHEQQLWLARDPFGMKPLYWWSDGNEVVFASSPTAVLDHPRVPVLPDLPMVSAYLSTLRTELAGHTLFEGLQTLSPGEVLEFDLNRSLSAPRSRNVGAPQRTLDPEMSLDDGADLLRRALDESVARHLVADVPVACLLSGGIDSTVIASLAGQRAKLPTYCAGTPTSDPNDLDFARNAAAELGMHHTQVEIDGARFDAAWSELIESSGVPLSTPNEVAILEVCRTLRADGNVVALSGEGADEILGGYEGVMKAARVFEEAGPSPLDGGRLHLELGAWIAPAVKSEVLSPDIWKVLDEDEFLTRAYSHSFELAQSEVGPEADPLEAHLRFLRRTNLTGLLGRLDKAAMAAGVEGRTPFADREVIAVAESLPMQLKIADEGRADGMPRGKHVLRHAFGDTIPRAVLERPKASFPLPFQDWLSSAAQSASASPFARSIFGPSLLDLVAADPRENWSYAWPILNIARWGDRWWQ